ncbi:MAG: hypothetical protein SGPRY_013817, partial [Prymnesium sp.]
FLHVPQSCELHARQEPQRLAREVRGRAWGLLVERAGATLPSSYPRASTETTTASVSSVSESSSARGSRWWWEALFSSCLHQKAWNSPSVIREIAISSQLVSSDRVGDGRFGVRQWEGTGRRPKMPKGEEASRIFEKFRRPRE